MYRQCPDCGAALDPGERCGCREEKTPCPLLLRKDDAPEGLAIECKVGLRVWRRVYESQAARDKTYTECCSCGRPCAVYGERCTVIRPHRIAGEGFRACGHGQGFPVAQDLRDDRPKGTFGALEFCSH